MTAPHLSDLALHRAVAGDSTLCGVTEHLAGCGACRARFDRVRAATIHFAEDAAMSSRLPALIAAVHASQLPERTPTPRFARVFRKLPWLGIGMMACAASAALVLGVRGDGIPDVVDEVSDNGFRHKGKAQDAFEIVRRNAEGNVELLAESAQVRPGDAIRFNVKLARPGFIGVIGLDAAHKVSAYAPDGPTLMAMTAGESHLLEGSIVLDSTLGPERIVLVICDAAHAIKAIVRTAQQALERAGGDPRAVGAISTCRELAYTIVKVQ